MKKRMQAASEAENFEVAASIRDQLQAFASVTERQAVIVGEVEDADIFGYAENNQRAAFHILMVREGNLIAGDSFVLDVPVQTPEEAMLEFFAAVL